MLLSMNDARVLLRGLPQRAVQILATGYKLLLPPMIAGGGESGPTQAIAQLQQQVGTMSHLGAKLPDIVRLAAQRPQQAPHKISPSTPVELREDATALLQLLDKSLNIRAKLIVDYNQTFVNMCRASHRVARDSVQRQTRMLTDYNNTVADICQEELMLAGGVKEKIPHLPETLETDLDHSFRTVLAKLDIPCTGVFARSDIPTHLKIQQLLAASKLNSPAAAAAVDDAASQLPRARIQPLLSELRQKVATHKILLMGGGGQRQLATLKQLSEDIERLRTEAQTEISKNTARTHEVLSEIYHNQPAQPLLSTPNHDSSIDLLRDLGRTATRGRRGWAAILCKSEPPMCSSLTIGHPGHRVSNT